ncbi:hypothetical protein [Candidatus Hakubella thermalkaliphila]|uniref:Nitrite/Sulfite reductase ferredoxin-like domain-containing protein n=1 Tax=Candidatus Hakubella thermalkaliphila TaxID=2754717 RepID=A0A6V8QFY4_9ACTN|nr:hypothetical protein [Candidatus Hakubella thermalkaliphila]GFP30214.1 hypothetical protein HKBW3S34_01135 [Candidatus Hakubella thermalkaliphila]GFP39989.1 hypothetical protein HKBW3S47_01686 [Candidatus Hakubella thermalkaliphila]GFP41681.1 hypothetical protein HKBW3C_00807 [Candidatus Hakubella thermalkaliphila]
MADRTGPTLDLDILKAGGLIKQRQPDLFSVRVRALAGNLTAGQLAKLGEISTKYGKGYVHVTMRQGGGDSLCPSGQSGDSSRGT